MTRSYFYLLLRIVKNDRNVNALLREKLTFKQIGDLTQKALDLKIIEKKGDEVILTTLGEGVFKKLSQQYKKINKSEWIEKEIKSAIEPLDINFLYLPEQQNLNLD
jgi:hypothetical protein